MRVKRRYLRDGPARGLTLHDLPAEIVSRILEMLPTVECIARVECVAASFHESAPTQSLVVDALRARAASQTGVPLPPSPTVRELYYFERCRRGVRLSPLYNDGKADSRRPIFLVRGHHQGDAAPSRPFSVIIGRTSSVAITDPRVSRRHAELHLPRVPAGLHEPFDLHVGRFDAIGHNPSRHLTTCKGGTVVERKLCRGQSVIVKQGDELHLVCDDVTRAHGRSTAFEGNTCAYRVDLVSENDLQQLALALHVVEGRPLDAFDFWDAWRPGRALHDLDCAFSLDLDATQSVAADGFSNDGSSNDEATEDHPYEGPKSEQSPALSLPTAEVMDEVEP